MPSPTRSWVRLPLLPHFRFLVTSPYNIVFHFKPLLRESIILLLPSPLAKPTLLQYYCARPFRNIRPRTDPPLYAVHHTILAMAISCSPICDVPFPRRRWLRRCSAQGLYKGFFKLPLEVVYISYAVVYITPWFVASSFPRRRWLRLWVNPLTHKSL